MVPPAHLLAFALSFAFAAPGAAAHDPACCGSVQGTQALGAALTEQTRQYYLELFTEVASACPLDIWRELKLGVEDLNQNKLTKTEADALYASVAARLPVVRVRWDGTTSVALSVPRLLLARGLERYVMVELENTSSAPTHMVSWFAGQAKSSLTWTPPGTIRAAFTPLRMDTLRPTQASLVLRHGSSETRVAVPIGVAEPATLFGTIYDADLGQPFPGRVRVTGSDGIIRHAAAYAQNSTLSEKTIAGTADSRYRLPFFYSDGSFQVSVPPGTVTVVLERGYEHRPVTRSWKLAPGEARVTTLSTSRFLDMRREGWISGDTHVHWSKNWWYENEDLDLLAVVQRAEDVAIVNNLALRHYWPALGETRTVPNHAPMGPIPGHDTGDYRIQMAQEYRNNPFYGHLNFLNLTSWPGGVGPTAVPAPYSPEGHVLPISTGDLLGPFAEDYPTNASRIDWALQQRPAEARPIIVAAHGCGGPVPAGAVLGKIDSIDMMSPVNFYRLLDCGLRIPLTDGADHPSRRVGNWRCYVKYVEAPSYGGWIDGILSGATFSTSGPLMLLDVNGTDVGGEVQASSGEALNVHLEVHSRFPIGRIQIVSNGQVLLDQSTSARSKTLDLPLSADQSRWIVARCSAAAEPTFRPRDEPDAAHTSAIYVVVEGADVFVDSGAAEHLRDTCQARGDDVWAKGTFYPPNAPAKRAEARDWFHAGRDAYQAILDAH